MFALTLALLVALSAAQDPAEGWLGYAKGVSPTGEGRITRAEAKWKVLDAPRRGGAFFSPWFGIESSDNLNLIQPVNPWTGQSWQMYIEYFQWQPTHNENSKGQIVNPGEILHGVVEFQESRQSYLITHTNLNTSWNVQTEIPVQRTLQGYKNYTIAYFVFEKEWQCSQYPPNDEVTFYDVVLEYDGQKVSPTWTTAYVDNVCNNRAHIVDESTIKITWNSQ